MSNSEEINFDKEIEENDEEFNDIDEVVGEAKEVLNGEKEEDDDVNMGIPDLPELTRKDKTLKEVLDMMEDQYAPIIPDTVTDYYLAKNGFETQDIKIKRLLALATQKFILDVAQDAYEYSRIRSASSVYNSSNPQVRAKQLLQGQQYANQLMAGAGSNGVNGEFQQPSHNSAGNQQGKIVLTMEDLSNALKEYGLNASRPDYYR